jgi:hypothetical protein
MTCFERMMPGPSINGKIPTSLMCAHSRCEDMLNDALVHLSMAKPQNFHISSVCSILQAFCRNVQYMVLPPAQLTAAPEAQWFPGLAPPDTLPLVDVPVTVRTGLGFRV